MSRKRLPREVKKPTNYFALNEGPPLDIEEESLEVRPSKRSKIEGLLDPEDVSAYFASIDTALPEPAGAAFPAPHGAGAFSVAAAAPAYFAPIPHLPIPEPVGVPHGSGAARESSAPKQSTATSPKKPKIKGVVQRKVDKKPAKEDNAKKITNLLKKRAQFEDKQFEYEKRASLEQKNIDKLQEEFRKVESEEQRQKIEYELEQSIATRDKYLLDAIKKKAEAESYFRQAQDLCEAFDKAQQEKKLRESSLAGRNPLPQRQIAHSAEAEPASGIRGVGPASGLALFPQTQKPPAAQSAAEARRLGKRPAKPKVPAMSHPITSPSQYLQGPSSRPIVPSPLFWQNQPRAPISPPPLTPYTLLPPTQQQRDSAYAPALSASPSNPGAKPASPKPPSNQQM